MEDRRLDVGDVVLDEIGLLALVYIERHGPCAHRCKARPHLPHHKTLHLLEAAGFVEFGPENLWYLTVRGILKLQHVRYYMAEPCSGGQVTPT